MDDLTENQCPPDAPVGKWRAQRKVMWICLAYALTFPLVVVLVPAELAQRMDAYAAHIYLLCGGVVMGWMGASAYSARGR